MRPYSFSRKMAVLVLTRVSTELLILITNVKSYLKIDGCFHYSDKDLKEGYGYKFPYFAEYSQVMSNMLSDRHQLTIRCKVCFICQLFFVFLTNIFRLQFSTIALRFSRLFVVLPTVNLVLSRIRWLFLTVEILVTSKL